MLGRMAGQAAAHCATATCMACQSGPESSREPQLPGFNVKAPLPRGSTCIYVCY